MRKGTRRSLLQGLAAGLVLLFWFQALARNWDEIAAYQWRIDWAWLLAAQGLLLLQSLLLASIWWYALRLMGAATPWRLGVSLWLKTQIARYVPGGVWDIAGRLALGHQEGLSVRALSASMVLEMALQVLSASLFLLLVPLLRGEMISDAYWPVAVILTVACLLVATPPVFSRLINLALKLLRRPPLAIQMTYRDMAMLLAARLLGHLLLGIGFVFFARGVTEISWSQAPVMMAAYVGAWLIGYLAVIVPMGIGVREGVLALLLRGLFPLSVIGAMALGYRTWLLVRDLLAALLGVWLGRRVKPVAFPAYRASSRLPGQADLVFELPQVLGLADNELGHEADQDHHQPRQQQDAGRDEDGPALRAAAEPEHEQVEVGLA